MKPHVTDHDRRKMQRRVAPDKPSRTTSPGQLPFLLDGDRTSTGAGIADAALFPAENPSPVFRVSPDGRVLCANRASLPLLAAWQVADDGCLPPLWRERLAGVLVTGESREWDVPCDDCTLQLSCVPIVSAGYVNVYGSDVTERVALLGQLTGERQRLAEAVRAAEQRAAELEITLDTIADGVVLYDRQGRIVRMNAGAVEIMGYSPADLRLPLAERVAWLKATLVDEPDATVKRLPLPRALAGETVRGLLMRFQRDGGGEAAARYVVVSAVPMVDAGGALTGVVASFSDVTEVRRARDELAQQAEERERLLAELAERNRALEAQAGEIRALNAGLERRVLERTAELEAIFASIPDGLYVADCSGIVRANQAALDSIGVASVEELQQAGASLEQRTQARYVDTGEPVSPSDTMLARALRGERMVAEVASRRLKDGDEVIHRSAGAPIVVDGKIVGAVGIATDITEQKRVQQQLAYQANLLARISDAVIATDLEQRITSWNQAAAEMFGWSEADALGRPFMEVLPTEFVNSSPEAIFKHLMEEGHWRGEMIVIGRDGRQVNVEATGVLVRDAQGQIVGQVGVSRDITRRKQVEAQNTRLLEELKANGEQLRALSRRLVAMQEAERSYVADQLYNQAGQVLAAVQLQLARLAKEADRRAGLLPDVDAALNEAMHELHDLASQLRPVGLDRSTLASVLRSHVTAFGQAHGLAVQFHAGNTDALRVPKDVGTAIYRAVQEGLANIARHAGATKVDLALARAGDALIVTLTDNGVGFEAQSIAGPGGLGLASMRERLETVGGQLQISSGPAGTTLHMQAPLRNAERVL